MSAPTVRIEPGSLAGLDALRVATVLIELHRNARQCRDMSGQFGAGAVRDRQNGYHSSFEHAARIAWRYAEIATAYEDAAVWIMAATAQSEFALALPVDDPEASPA